MTERVPTLYLMLGYPGAGKTTAADEIAKVTGAAHLASDKIRLEMFPDPQFTEEEHTELYEELNERTEQLLRDGKDVIYDANLNRHIHRQEKYDICARTGAKPSLIWVKAPEELAKQRATHDSRSDLWPEGEAANQMFDRLVDVFEPPAIDEPYIELDGTKINEKYIREALDL